MRLGVPTLLVVCGLLLAGPAHAGEEQTRVNEISVAEGKVELLDLIPYTGPGDFEFDGNYGYALRAYDGAGNEVAALEWPQPVPDFLQTTPVVLDLALPAGSGQVCFEEGRESPAVPPAAYRLHCVGYGTITNPVVRRQRLYGGVFAMPVAPVPGPGQTLQRQPCGRVAPAAPTLGGRNATLPAVCADLSPVCDDPDSNLKRAQLTLKLPRVHDVDRPLVARVKLSNNGKISMRGSFFASGLLRGYAFGPIERKLRANVTARVRIPITRRGRALVKRAGRRGDEVRGFLVSVGQGTCERAKWHSSRQFTVVP